MQHVEQKIKAVEQVLKQKAKVPSRALQISTSGQIGS